MSVGVGVGGMVERIRTVDVGVEERKNQFASCKCAAAGIAVVVVGGGGIDVVAT